MRDEVADVLADFAPAAPREVLTRAEAADLLRVCLDKLDKLAREGAIPTCRVGADPRFLRSALLAWLASTGGRA